jgi:iron complex outermembrane receptor protein
MKWADRIIARRHSTDPKPTGYKDQRSDISTGFTPTPAAYSVRPETSKAYKIGVRSRFLDNRVQLNVTGFWTDFNDF